MKFIKCEKLEKSMAELQFSIDAEAFKGAVADVFKKEGKKYSVPGFRKGKAPRSLIEKMYGADVFTYDAINELFPAAYEAAVKEAGIEPVGRPEVSVDAASETEGVTLTVKVAVMPEVKVGNYNGLTVEKTVHTVTDEAVDAELKRVQERNARELTREGAAENGDIADIDFEGFVDGVAFEGGKAEHYNLTLGSGSFIPGFEEQVVGHKAGEEFDVNVKFPEEYHAKELAGKDATFKCTIRSIKTKELPAIDDELAKKVSKFETLDELKADIRKNLEENAERTAENDQKSAAIEMATNNITVDIPAVMIDNRVTAMIQEMAMRLEQQGMKLEQYLQYAGTDIAKLREQYRETAEKNVKTDLMLEEVAKAEDIKVEAKDLDEEVAAMAAAYGATPQQVQKIIKEQGRIGDLAASVLRKKTAQFIIDNIAK